MGSVSGRYEKSRTQRSDLPRRNVKPDEIFVAAAQPVLATSCLPVRKQKKKKGKRSPVITGLQY